MSLKDLHSAYKEDCNCGYIGSFSEYLLSVGVNLSELELDEGKEDE